MKIIQQFYCCTEFYKRHWSLYLIGKYLSHIIYKPVSAILYWQIYIMRSVHTDVMGRSMAQKHSLGFFSFFFLIIFVHLFIHDLFYSLSFSIYVSSFSPHMYYIMQLGRAVTNVVITCGPTHLLF